MDPLEESNHLLSWGRKNLKIPDPKKTMFVEAKTSPETTRVLLEWTVPDRAGNPQTVQQWVSVGSNISFDHTMNFDYGGQKSSVVVSHNFKVLQIEK